MTTRRWLRVSVALFLGAIASAGLHAQTFPAGDLRMVVGYAPGGGTDGTARLFSTRLQAKLGVSVIVDNRPGALGQIGAQLVSKQAPNGRTLLITSSSPILAAPHLQPVFNPVKELTPVTLLTRFPGVLVVPASSRWKTLEDGQTIVGSTPQQFQQEVAREYEKIGALIRELNLK